ncbi:MAG: sporulation protein YunB [Firmicutes bacterium HGW-Firmicutes-13]|nr:MAG: sporulation protein YunB [Firmicutes bacterium HGW-Firmicutes-13]
MFSKRKSFKVSRKLVIFLFIALILFATVKIFIYMEKNLRPTILASASFYADMLATEAINEAVRKEIAENMLYDNLVQLEKDNYGKIVMAQINTMEVNRIMTLTTLRVQETLKSMEGEIIRLPLGQALGSYILANIGPRIPIVLIPIGRVNTNIVDIFEDAGINQTRHKIYLHIKAEVQVVIPFISSATEVITQVPIAECLYQGEVPDTVINLQFPAGTVPTPVPGFP